MKYDSGMKSFKYHIIYAVKAMLSPSEQSKVKELAAGANASLLREYLKENHGKCRHGGSIFDYSENGASFYNCTSQNFVLEFDVPINNLGDKDLMLSWSQLCVFIKNHIDDIFADNKEE